MNDLVALLAAVVVGLVLFSVVIRTLTFFLSFIPDPESSQLPLPLDEFDDLVRECADNFTAIYEILYPDPAKRPQVTWRPSTSPDVISVATDEPIGWDLIDSFCRMPCYRWPYPELPDKDDRRRGIGTGSSSRRFVHVNGSPIVWGTTLRCDSCQVMITNSDRESPYGRPFDVTNYWVPVYRSRSPMNPKVVLTWVS